MKKFILPLLAIMALFVSCSDDSEGTQPYDNTFYGNLIYNAAIVASDAKCDVSIVDNVATVTLYAVKFAPAMPAMDIVIPGISCVKSNTGYLLSAENVVPLVAGVPVEAYAMSKVTGEISGGAFTVSCVTSRGTIVFDNRFAMPGNPALSDSSYAGELLVGGFAKNTVVDVTFNEAASTVDIVINDAKFAENMPLVIDIALRGIPYTSDETITFAATDVVPYINAEPEPVNAYTFATFEGNIVGGRLVLAAKMSENLAPYVAGKVFEFSGEIVE